MEFNYRLIAFVCACGTPRSHVKVGINSFGELVCQWKCIKCGRAVMSRTPLEKLIAGLPPPPQKLLPAPDFSAEDVSLLSDMCISIPKEMDSEQT